MGLNVQRGALAVLLTGVLSGTAAAQVGRVGGIVRDDSGNPIKGATVTASNPDIGPTTFTATTDDRGRFNIIGLRAGQWRFLAQAPGHAAEAGQLAVRFGSPNPPLTFTLRRNGPGLDAPLGGVSARDLQASLAAADALFNQQRWDEAIAAYRTIMARTPALTVINLQIAAAHRARHDYDAAIASYNALLAADPANQKATVGIALTHLERGSTRAAEEVLLTAAKQPGAGRDVYYALGDVTLANGDAAGAAVWFEKASASDPSWGKPVYKLGTLAMERGDTTAAAALMTRVIAVDPISPEAALAQAALNRLNR
jgi:Tfp pilus assembly protein PilF